MSWQKCAARRGNILELVGLRWRWRLPSCRHAGGGVLLPSSASSRCNTGYRAGLPADAQSQLEGPRRGHVPNLFLGGGSPSETTKRRANNHNGAKQSQLNKVPLLLELVARPRARRLLVLARAVVHQLDEGCHRRHHKPRREDEERGP